MNQQLWGEMLDVLKDIGGYLTKQDAEQTRAKLDKPPKISENQADEPIVGGDAPTGKPGTGVAKSMRKSVIGGTARANPQNTDTGEMSSSDGSTAIGGSGGIRTKDSLQNAMGDEIAYADDEEGLETGGFGGDEEAGGFGGGMEDEMGGDMEPDSIEDCQSVEDCDALIAAAEAKKAELEGGEEGGKGGGPTGMDMNEMKSLLKDIRSSLIANSKAPAISKSIAQEIKKSVQPLIRDETQRMMRKMGFRPSRPDVTRFGVDEDTNSLRKSADEGKKDNMKDLEKTLDNMSGMSWQQLGQMREGLGQFNPFGR